MHGIANNFNGKRHFIIILYKSLKYNKFVLTLIKKICITMTSHIFYEVVVLPVVKPPVAEDDL